MAAGGAVAYLGLRRTGVTIIRWIVSVAEDDVVATQGRLNLIRMHEGWGEDRLAALTLTDAFEEVLVRGTVILCMPGTNVPTVLPEMLLVYARLCQRGALQACARYQPVFEEASAMFGVEASIGLIDSGRTLDVLQSCEVAKRRGYHFLRLYRAALNLTCKGAERADWEKCLAEYLSTEPPQYLREQAKSLFPLYCG